MLPHLCHQAARVVGGQGTPGTHPARAHAHSLQPLHSHQYCASGRRSSHYTLTTCTRMHINATILCASEKDSSTHQRHEAQKALCSSITATHPRNTSGLHCAPSLPIVLSRPRQALPHCEPKYPLRRQAQHANRKRHPREPNQNEVTDSPPGRGPNQTSGPT